MQFYCGLKKSAYLSHCKSLLTSALLGLAKVALELTLEQASPASLKFTGVLTKLQHVPLDFRKLHPSGQPGDHQTVIFVKQQPGIYFLLSHHLLPPPPPLGLLCSYIFKENLKLPQTFTMKYYLRGCKSLFVVHLVFQ